MTIGGALSDLDNLLKADDIPCYYKPSIKAVMDTVKLSSSEKPNYTDDEIQKMQDLEFAEIQKAYELGKAESSSEIPTGWISVLDKIRDEIENIKVIRDEYSQRQNDYCDGVEFAKKICLQIIDKYKTSPIGVESEE